MIKILTPHKGAQDDNEKKTQKNSENDTDKGVLKARKILVYIEVHEFSEPAQYLTQKLGERAYTQFADCHVQNKDTKTRRELA